MKIQWNKVTWYSKVAAVVVGVTIFILGIYIGVMYQRGVDALELSEWLRIDRQAPIRNTKGIESVRQYEFVQEGNIKNNATEESEIDDWVFIYEKPGAPALSVGIYFMTNSQCVTGERKGICNPAVLEQGQRVKIMGKKDSEGKIIIEQMVILREN